MNAKEARQLTDESKAIESMGSIFQKVKMAANNGKSVVYLQLDEIDQADCRVLAKLGYEVRQRTDSDDFGRNRAYDWEISW